MEFEEKFLAADDDTPLFLRSAKLSAKTRADVLLTHGIGEHSARYFHVAERLARDGFRLCAYDLRGHGRSGGRRGDVANGDLFLDDLRIVLRHYQSESVPIFLYGHSMGAQITLNFILRDSPQLAGLIVASPWLRLAFQPSEWKLFLVRMFLKIYPAFTQNTGNNSSSMSRDRAFLDAMPDGHLMHSKMSARLYSELTIGAEHAYSAAQKFTAPLLLIHGAADPITSLEATRDFFERCNSPDKTLRIYCGMLHETQNETARQLVISDIAEWLSHRAE